MQLVIGIIASLVIASVATGGAYVLDKAVK